MPNEIVLLRLRDPGRSALAKPTLAVLRLSHRTRHGDLAAALERLARAVREDRVDVGRYAIQKSFASWVVQEFWHLLAGGKQLDPSTLDERGRPVK